MQMVSKANCEKTHHEVQLIIKSWKNVVRLMSIKEFSLILYAKYLMSDPSV